MPTFWIALVALYVGFYKLNWFPGAGRLDPGVDPPRSITGLYTIDALLHGNLGSSDGFPSPDPSALVSRRSTSAC